MKTSSVHRPPAMAVKKEQKRSRKGPKKGTAAMGKANSGHYWLLPEKVNCHLC